MSYFAIGIEHPKHEVNVGTLWRSADSPWLDDTDSLDTGDGYGDDAA